VAEEFKVGQKVKYKTYPSGPQGRIVHIEDNVALVKFGFQDNRTIKLSELVSAEPAPVEPFKAGWFRLARGRADNFIYYVQSIGANGNSLVYTMAYNPKTGELDADFNHVSVLIPKVLLQSPRDLIRQKMVDEVAPTNRFL